MSGPKSGAWARPSSAAATAEIDADDLETADPSFERFSVASGRVVGAWRLGPRVATGASGEIYDAEHVRIAGHRAAVKILRGERLGGRPGERLLREASAAGRVAHENVVQVFDAGITPDGVRYLVMELLRGESLAARLAHGRIEEARALGIGVQVARALCAAHNAGVVHRDLKPDNIHLVPRAAEPDFVKVLDFGVARLPDEADPRSRGRNGTRAVLGTPAYLAPEQWRSAPDLDGRADIYALGVTLFECVTGRLPFQGLSFYDWMTAHLSQPVPPASAMGPVRPAFANLIRCMMAKQPDDRPWSMREVERALTVIATRP